MGLAFDEARVRAALKKSWSRHTAIQWTADNPASGQCNVTAAVIFDLFGGEILRTQLPGVWHYYNRINGVRFDLTDSQFSAPGALFDAPESYDDEVSDKASAMTNIPAAEYDTLMSALQHELSSSSTGSK